MRGLVADARQRLAKIYAAPAEADEKRRLKQAEIARLRRDYQTLKTTKWGGYSGYDGWFGRDLNNAHLSSVSTYTRWVGAFGVLLAEHDGDLPRFYAAVESLAKEDDDVVLARLEALAVRAQ